MISVLMLVVGQSALLDKIRHIAADAQGTVSVSCSLPSCDLNPHFHAPMQSVFKLPLVLTLLHQVEQGKFSLDQPIPFRRSDLFHPAPISELQSRYPKAEVKVPLRTLMKWTVSLSDNTASEILLRLAGGPSSVSSYISSLGVSGFQLRDGERALHQDTRLQYRNWLEPSGAVQLLRVIQEHSPLTHRENEMLLSWMRPEVPTKRLQGLLPAGVAVAHKSGSSDVERGVAAATNDIGLMSLPNGRQVAVAVFVTDSRASQSVREGVIARIGRAIYDAALRRK